MKFSVPNPCSENWQKMTPNEHGRFCSSCEKTVIDFTRMSTDEIKQYFKSLASSVKSVCGRFKATDLNDVVVFKRIDVFPNQYAVRQKWLPSKLFLSTMGILFMFSCEQQFEIQEPRNVNIEHQDSITKKSHLHPLVDSASINSNSNPIDKIGKIVQKKTVVQPPMLLGDVEFEEEDEHVRLSGIAPVDINFPDPDPAYSYINPTEPSEPEFPGGEQALFDFIRKNLKYSYHSMTSGKVYASFMVEEDGSLSEIQILRSLSPENDKEVIRLIQSMPKWKPAEIRGKSLRNRVVLPFGFQ